MLQAHDCDPSVVWPPGANILQFHLPHAVTPGILPRCFTASSVSHVSRCLSHADSLPGPLHSSPPSITKCSSMNLQVPTLPHRIQAEIGCDNKVPCERTKVLCNFAFYNRALGFHSICARVISFSHQYHSLPFQPSCTYPADNPEPCEVQQLTSTAVVIDHGITIRQLVLRLRMWAEKRS